MYLKHIFLACSAMILTSCSMQEISTISSNDSMTRTNQIIVGMLKSINCYGSFNINEIVHVKWKQGLFCVHDLSNDPESYLVTFVSNSGKIYKLTYSSKHQKFTPKLSAGLQNDNSNINELIDAINYCDKEINSNIKIKNDYVSKQHDYNIILNHIEYTKGNSCPTMNIEIHYGPKLNGVLGGGLDFTYRLNAKSTSYKLSQ